MTQSDALYKRAFARIPGGVMSPARSYQGVGLPSPVFLERGEGAHVFDVDGNRYIDYLGAYGPHILGHGDPAIKEALHDQIERGLLFGTPNPLEVQLAERLHEAIPEVEKVRLVSSGTEAVMSVVRLARAVTGRDVILKFDGDYHGHFDAVLVKAGSGASQVGDGGSHGIPRGVSDDVVTVPYNDLEAARDAARSLGHRLAAILVEPVSGNMGVVLPRRGFLEGLRCLADETGALLVYDEVIVAFRRRFGAAFPLVGPVPDLLAMGKILGGGLCLGAYGGRARFMDQVAPSGFMYQAGTLAGNPLSARAALALLDRVAAPGFYERLDGRAERLAEGLLEEGTRAGWDISLTRFGSMWTLFFRKDAPENLDEAKDQDSEAFAAFFRGMLGRGVLLAPSFYEAWFLTDKHSDRDVEDTLRAARQVFRA